MNPFGSLAPFASGLIDATGEHVAALTDRLTDLFDEGTGGGASAALAVADKVLAGVLGIVGSGGSVVTGARTEDS